MNDILTPKRALLSVSDKAGIVELGKFLESKNVEIYSSGGTSKTLEQAGIRCLPVEKLTGNPEAFDGRMKTLSFEISSALLYRRNSPADIEQAKKLGIEALDIVVVNFYPFEQAALKDPTEPELIEQIDIGGPTLVRAAAKNNEAVSCLTSPDQYAPFMADWTANNGVTLEMRKQLASRAFEAVAFYDLAIATELASRFAKPLRYGENPHQKGVLLSRHAPGKLTSARILQGKELSYNNWLDADAAYSLISDLHAIDGQSTSCVVIKHANPCGVASTRGSHSPLPTAWDCDPVSAFGSVIALNRKLTAVEAQFLVERFIEVIIAPAYEPAALELLKTKPNVRVLELAPRVRTEHEWEFRTVDGGLLAQTRDRHGTIGERRSPTKIPFPSKMAHLAEFGTAVIRTQKSNAVALVTLESNGDLRLLASGVGQPNRLDCLRLLITPRLKGSEFDPENTVLISEAFFPFRDSIDEAARLGVRHIVQPGGSIKDKDVIQACDEYEISMMLTGIRSFKH